MQTSRTPLTTTSPVTLAAVKAHARVDASDEDAAIDLMARAAAAEIEAQSGIALLAQIVTVTLDAWGDVIDMPVGPLYAAGLTANPVTVQARDEAGNLSAVTAFWMEAGRYPRLHLTSEVEAVALVVSYPAGHGTTEESVPVDMRMAIADQAVALIDLRGDTTARQGLTNLAARVVHANRRVRA